MEENIRLRQAINDVVLTNQRWLRYNREQTAHVQLLLQRLRSAEEERKKLHDQLEATRSLMEVQRRESPSPSPSPAEIQRHLDDCHQLIRSLERENSHLRFLAKNQVVCRCCSSVGASSKASAPHRC